MLKYYYLNRIVDHSGNSGVGKVAHVFSLPDFGALLIWDEKNALGISSVVVYKSVDDLLKVHGHEGDSVLVEQSLDNIENIEDIIEAVDKAQDIFVFVANELFELDNLEEE